jgi:hypothetical protein
MFLETDFYRASELAWYRAVKLQRAQELDDTPDNDHLLERSFLIFKEAFEEAEEREKVHSTRILFMLPRTEHLPTMTLPFL